VVHHLAHVEPIEHVHVQFEAKASQTDVITYVPVVLGGDGGAITQVAFYSNGYIRAFGPSGWYNVIPYSTNTWYTFDLEIDAAAQLFHLTIDGVEVLRDQPFRTAQQSIRTLRYGIQGGGAATAAYWINNVKVVIPAVHEST